MLTVTGITILLSIIPLRLAITWYQVPEPQAIFVLGGDIYRRIPFTAKFAQENPKLEIWLSDFPRAYKYSSRILQEAGVVQERIHYDFCATDTVTNFTCTVEDFVEKDLRHLYLITSDYHMRRAKAIATIIFGSRGIIATPISVPSNVFQPESWLRVLRDSIRSLLWIVNRKTGASFNPALKSRYIQNQTVSFSEK